MHIHPLPRLLGLTFGLALVSACAATNIRPEKQTNVVGLERPHRILVYDFATRDATVSANSSSTSAARARLEGKSPAARKSAVAREAVDALATDLVADLVHLGFDASRVERGTPASRGDLVVDGEFVDIVEGNRLRRVVIGFGSGESSVNTRVHVYQGAERTRLLDFATHSDSGELPGTAVTMTVGAAATGGVSAAAAVAGAAVMGVNARRSATAQMAGRSADQATNYLSEFFAKQGWIQASESKTAKRG